ncbi:PKD domain-containing protein [Paracrocinitomix mangrovi]|uniref:PKD domain-containing protein n=1 Tax=Paracrocinitomix mangrovi TaxID=2862509 RepID=UPI001C8E39D8|nr:PKD domain-containing protein [Paracrocinitomix mangrovi]UKN01703.1 PKD domain-containing protein [Paracrocinitomix mangrovi]
MAKHGLGILLILLAFSCKEDPPAPLPTANFYVDNNGCTSGCWVYFYNQSYSAVAWDWNFGNGITSDLENDSIHYQNPGFYDVTLKVWNADGVEDQITKQIQIN